MYENSKIMLLRLCGVLKALHVSVKFVVKIASEKFKLVKALFTEVENFLRSDCTFNQQRLLISAQNVSMAYNLLSYFKKHKLILAGYDFDVNLPLNEAIGKILVAQPKTTTTTTTTAEQKFTVKLEKGI